MQKSCWRAAEQGLPVLKVNIVELAGLGLLLERLHSNLDSVLSGAGYLLRAEKRAPVVSAIERSAH